MRDRSTYQTQFGEALSRQLSNTGTTQKGLADLAGVSPSYTNQLMTGRKSVSPEWVDMIADVLNLSTDARVELHRAAASDLGYKLDMAGKKEKE